jgi:hypothetical protein
MVSTFDAIYFRNGFSFRHDQLQVIEDAIATGLYF